MRRGAAIATAALAALGAASACGSKKQHHEGGDGDGAGTGAGAATGGALPIVQVARSGHLARVVADDQGRTWFVVQPQGDAPSTLCRLDGADLTCAVIPDDDLPRPRPDDSRRRDLAPPAPGAEPIVLLSRGDIDGARRLQEVRAFSWEVVADDVAAPMFPIAWADEVTDALLDQGAAPVPGNRSAGRGDALVHDAVVTPGRLTWVETAGDHQSTSLFEAEVTADGLRPPREIAPLPGRVKVMWLERAGDRICALDTALERRVVLGDAATGQVTITDNLDQPELDLWCQADGTAYLGNHGPLGHVGGQYCAAGACRAIDLPIDWPQPIMFRGAGLVAGGLVALAIDNQNQVVLAHGTVDGLAPPRHVADPDRRLAGVHTLTPAGDGALALSPHGYLLVLDRDGAPVKVSLRWQGPSPLAAP